MSSSAERRSLRPLAFSGLLLALMAPGLGSFSSADAQTAISADGEIESTADGFRFPDGTLQATAAIAESGRRFYLSQDHVMGDATVDACAAGFHFASIWEILDPSNLVYDTTLGATFPTDSGSGPPTARQGWVRTGDEPRPTDIEVGLAGCALTAGGDPWTTASMNITGTLVRLVDPVLDVWNSPATHISPWVGDTASCDTSNPVWCIED